MGKIAILMSTYNGERFIEKQFQSIANQKCRHEINLYIRDDGSSDNTKQIIDSWQDKIIITFIQGENIKPAHSFWELIINKNIKADYYAFCDQDDIWDSDKLELAISRLRENTHLYACNCRVIDAEDNIIEQQRKKKNPNISLEKLFVSGMTQGCAMVFTNALREYICKKTITCIPMHDLIVCMYGIVYGEFYWDEIPHFSYRFHDNNVVANKKRKNIIFKIFAKKKMDVLRRGSLKKVAEELLINCEIQDENAKTFIEKVRDSQVSFKNKIDIIRNKNIKEMERNALISFYVRTLTNRL